MNILNCSICGNKTICQCSPYCMPHTIYSNFKCSCGGKSNLKLEHKNSKLKNEPNNQNLSIDFINMLSAEKKKVFELEEELKKRNAIITSLRCSIHRLDEEYQENINILKTSQNEQLKQMDELNLKLEPIKQKDLELKESLNLHKKKNVKPVQGKIKSLNKPSTLKSSTLRRNLTTKKISDSKKLNK